jgi:hypothetical protein
MIRSASILGILLLWGARSWASFEAIGDPVEGNSWFQKFQAHGQGGQVFDQITVSILSSDYDFEPAGMQGWTQEGPDKHWRVVSPSVFNAASPPVTALKAQGDRANWVGWEFSFYGDRPPQKGKPIELQLKAWNGSTLVEDAIASYKPTNGNWTWQVRLLAVPVPEAPTYIAGALLLLPFGASAVRILRKRI